MGASNVAAAFTYAADLSHGAFRLLVGMANTALDEASVEGRPPRVYFGGMEHMRHLMGNKPKQRVTEALRVLRDNGYIKVLEHGHNGRKAVYALVLDGTHVPESRGTENVTGRGTENVTKGHGKRDGRGTDSVHPRNQGGTTEEQGEEQGVRQETKLSAPVDNPNQRQTGHEQIGYAAAYLIVTAALDIEAASERIKKIVQQGLTHRQAWIELARELRQEAPS